MTKKTKPVPDALQFDVNWVWESAVARADRWAKELMNELIDERDDSAHTPPEVLISQTASFFLMACFLNKEILDEDHLDNMLKTAKSTAKFIADMLPPEPMAEGKAN